MDVEQTPVVVLCCHRHRQFNAFHLLEPLQLVTFFNSFLLLKQLGRYGAASRQVAYGSCDVAPNTSLSQLHLESMQSSSQVYTYVFSEYEACRILQLINDIAMVDYKCRSGHINSSYDDLPRA
jgi:hypothetical protein